MSAFQYRAHCRRCLCARELSRAVVMTGANPLCDHCGEVMVVYSGPLDAALPGNQEQRMRAVEGS